MNRQYFISIGTKGTSLPLSLTKLTQRLSIGFNKYPWAGRGKVADAEKAHGWVSKNIEPFELYLLSQAIRDGRVQQFSNATWIAQADHRKHVGEAFLPLWWEPGDKQPTLVAVRSKKWGHGCVSQKLIRDGRNRDTVARLDLDDSAAVNGPQVAARRLAARDEHWTNDELRATVAAYLQMLRRERDGRRFRNAEYNERLRATALSTRSRASVEYRLKNISAVLDELGYPWIEGYKPQRNVGEGVKARLRRLLLEAAPVMFTLYEPSPDIQEVARRTSALLRGPTLRRPAGEAIPKSVERTTKQFVRDPKVQAFVRREAKGKCESCREPAPFVDEHGDPFLEVHHVVPLADGGPDTVDNAAALCPNCHRRLHHGRDRLKAQARLYSQVGRLQSPR